MVDYHGTTSIREVPMTAGMTIVSRDAEMPLQIPADVFDLAGFRRWVHSRGFPQKVHASYIAGKIEIDMSPEEIFSHNSPKTAIGAAFVNWVDAHNLGDCFGDGALLVNEAADVANEPDLIFCRWETISSGKIELRETHPGSERCVELVGTPDLVIEIVSRSSVTKDTVRLKERYALAGISEYWLIDCRGRTIKFDLLALHRGKYRLGKPDADGARLSPVLDARIKLTRYKSPIMTWKYRLTIER